MIAENEEIAAQAAELIKIEYEDLPVITNTDQASEEGAFLLHPYNKSNELCSFKIRYGDIAKGFEGADVVIEGDYETPAQEHAYLQPEAGLSYIDEEGRVTVVVAGSVDPRRPRTDRTCFEIA